MTLRDNTERPITVELGTNVLAGTSKKGIMKAYGEALEKFFRDNIRHHSPHIHIRYQSDEATVSIEEGNILDGDFPPKQLKMVQAWIEIHKEELMVDWQLAVNGDEPFRIAPLQ